MPARSPSSRPLHTRLGQIAEILDDAHASCPEPTASLVRLAVADDGEVELELAPLPPGEVLWSLLGTTTPPEWDAVGVVLDGAERERGGAIRAVVLCARDGSTASVLRRAGRERELVVAGPEDPGPAGRVADALRRSLALPTDAPAVPVDRAVVQVWLHRVHSLALGGEPVDRALADALRPSAPASWGALRDQRAAGSWEEIDCAPDLAAWMDDGMFARWCVAGFPEPLEVLVELGELVEPGVAEHLVERLAAASVRP